MKKQFRIVTTPDSGNIEKFGYDLASKTLCVTFKGGASYEYLNVPAEVVQGFFTAESVGSYFSKVIRPAFETKKLSAPWETATADEEVSA